MKKIWGGVSLINQKTAAYKLNRESKFRFYFRMFFDLPDVTLVNSHTVPQKLGQTDLRISDFNIVIANSLMRDYINHQITFPQSRPNKERS